ncbi:MAG: hypothetical protein KDA22_14745 [Phycisphaerales bacterium]|nr:hypothetical protein [Phycisphaerales bacterium]
MGKGTLQRRPIRTATGLRPGGAALVMAMTASALAGQPTTTVIAHGYSPDSKGAWVEGMAAAILARAGGAGTVYRYTGATGGWSVVPEAGGDGSDENVVLIFNWVPESASVAVGPNLNYVQAAGDALYAVLRDAPYAAGDDGPGDLVSGRTVHFIGHSRGACVVSETIRRLALAEIPVDQMTTLDPHPVNGTLDARYNFNWGDPVPVRWSNVVWADNIWRADGGGLINGLDFDGIALANVFNTQLSESVLNCCGYFFSHSDVHLWYHGTIDLSPNPSDGEQTITSQMRSTWWPEGYAEKGFYYSAIGGGAAERPAIGAGTDPPADSAPTISNGSFDQGTYAGWSYHGGGGANLVNDGGNWIARMAAADPLLTHNLAFMPDEPEALSLRIRRVGGGATDDVVHLALQRNDDLLPVELPFAAWAVSDLNPTFDTVSANVPPEFRGRTCRVSLRLDGGADGVDATVDVDDVVVAPTGPSGDLDGDGTVGGADLGLLLGAWGPCPACAADLDGNGMVDGADLGLLLAQWTG